jgi:hypothetical protein
MLNTMRTVLRLLVLVPLLSSCGSGGLFNMSEDWCRAHVNASEARCGTRQERVAERNTERSAARDSDIQQHN